MQRQAQLMEEGAPFCQYQEKTRRLMTGEEFEKVLPWEPFLDLIESDRITSQNRLIQNDYSTEPQGDMQQAR